MSERTGRLSYLASRPVWFALGICLGTVIARSGQAHVLVPLVLVAATVPLVISDHRERRLPEAITLPVFAAVLVVVFSSLPTVWPQFTIALTTLLAALTLAFARTPDQRPALGFADVMTLAIAGFAVADPRYPAYTLGLVVAGGTTFAWLMRGKGAADVPFGGGIMLAAACASIAFTFLVPGTRR